MLTVNAVGDACPIPVIKTKKAMQELKETDSMEVIVDNEIAVQNVTKMAESQGARVSVTKLREKEYQVLIQIGKSNQQENNQKDEQNEGTESCCCKQEKTLVVVVSSDKMGEGKDDLGAVLLKGFLFAISQLEKLPQAILFYNGGAKLTAEGSDSIEDLKIMEQQGVQIMTCGTCLDYYQLKEKLEVGTVTNMYTIVEMLSQADQIIRP